jgi:hypothetical protein
MKRLIFGLAPVILMLGIAQPASAHRGDWGTQWVKTRDSAQVSCNARAGCTGIDLYTWRDEGDHSRRFTWWLFFNYSVCAGHYHPTRQVAGISIGHTYDIWDKDVHCVTGPD